MKKVLEEPKWCAVELFHQNESATFSYTISYLRQGSSVSNLSPEDLSKIVTAVGFSEYSKTMRFAKKAQKSPFTPEEAYQVLSGELHGWQLWRINVTAAVLILTFKHVSHSEYGCIHLGKNFSELQLQIHSAHSDLTCRLDPHNYSKERQQYITITEPSTFNLYLCRGLAEQTWWGKFRKRPRSIDCRAMVVRSMSEAHGERLLRFELSGQDLWHLDSFAL